MLTELFVSNLAHTTVTHGGMSEPAPGTIETLTVSESDGIFPVVRRGFEQFHFKDRDPEAAGEIFRCIGTDGSHWTVVRGAEGTRPVSHGRKFTIRQVITSEFLQRLGSGSTTELVNAVTVFGADPTCEMDSGTALVQALASGPVYLTTGVYRIDAPLNLLPGSVLISFGHAIIRPSSRFSGDAAVEIIDGDLPVRLENITLDGTELGAGSDICGVYAETEEIEAELRNVRITGFPSGGAIISGAGWLLDRVTAQRNYGCGFELNITDSLALGCRALHNSSYGFSGYYQDQLIGCLSRGNRLGDYH